MSIFASGKQDARSVKDLFETIVSQEKLIEKLNGRIEALELRHTADQESTKTLIDALQARRKAYLDIVPLLSGAFTTGLILTFAYQVYKGAEVDAMVKQIGKTEASLDLQRVSQAQLSGRMTRALMLVTNGYRDSSRNRELSAYLSSREALEELRDWMPLLDVARGIKDKITLDPAHREELEAIRPSMDALLETTIAAYELQGRASVLLYNAKQQGFIQKTLESGKQITSLAPHRWEGPHFMGIAKDNLSDYTTDPKSKDRLRTEARTYYETAIQNDEQRASIDMINLAESYFMSGDYPEACLNARRYLDLEKDLAPKENAFVCGIYFRLGKLGETGKVAYAASAYRFMKQMYASSPNVFRNYSWESLKALKEGGASTFTKVKPEIGRIMADCVAAVLDANDGVSVQALDLKYPTLAALPSLPL